MTLSRFLTAGAVFCALGVTACSGGGSSPLSVSGNNGAASNLSTLPVTPAVATPTISPIIDPASPKPSPSPTSPVGCGTPNPRPSATPTAVVNVPTPTPPPPSISPKAIAFGSTTDPTRTATISAGDYAGVITRLADNCSGIISVSQDVANGPSVKLTVTPLSVGSCTLKYSAFGSDTISEPVTVTATTFVVH